MVEGNFPLRWQAQITGDIDVKQKMQALLEVQQKGSRASAEAHIIAKQARTELNEQTRSMNTLVRSWQSAHPNLALLSRGFSALASVGHSLLSIINSLNLMQIRQREEQERLRDIQQNVLDLQKEYNDAVVKYGKDAPQTIALHQKLTAAFRELAVEQERISQAKFQDVTTQLAALLSLGGSVGQMATAIKAFSLSIGVLTVALKSLYIAAAPIAGALTAVLGVISLIQVQTEGHPALLEMLFGKETIDAIEASWTKFKREIYDTFVHDIPQIFYFASQIITGVWNNMWKQIHDTLLSVGDKIKNQFRGWWDWIVGGFKDLYNKVVGKSIIPEMMNEMESIVKTGVDKMVGDFTTFGDKTKTVLEQMKASSIQIVDGMIASMGGLTRLQLASMAPGTQLPGGGTVPHLGVGPGTTGSMVSPWPTDLLQAALRVIPSLSVDRTMAQFNAWVQGLPEIERAAAQRIVGGFMAGSFTGNISGVQAAIQQELANRGQSFQGLVGSHHITKPTIALLHEGETVVGKSGHGCGIVINVYGSLITERELMHTVSKAIANRVDMR